MTDMISLVAEKNPDEDGSGNYRQVTAVGEAGTRPLPPAHISRWKVTQGDPKGKMEPTTTPGILDTSSVSLVEASRPNGGEQGIGDLQEGSSASMLISR